VLFRHARAVALFQQRAAALSAAAQSMAAHGQSYGDAGREVWKP
jgi:hypothetical protein